MHHWFSVRSVPAVHYRRIESKRVTYMCVEVMMNM